ncbi:hypothetical protein CEXT_473041 [Caerostris extrusa]|uniref:Uncharacterized protein n=1 Tax=Caerostris extrusa TaxID=172846 RepID=A0AAV4NK59_CAEEX|nr:hypothetical protein CEXT_473041 [Caerostris extrusa]
MCPQQKFTFFSLHSGSGRHKNLVEEATCAIIFSHNQSACSPYSNVVCMQKGEALIPKIPNFEESGFLMTTSFWDYFVVGKAQTTTTTIVNHVLSCEPYKKVR